MLKIYASKSCSSSTESGFKQKDSFEFFKLIPHSLLKILVLMTVCDLLKPAIWLSSEGRYSQITCPLSKNVETTQKPHCSTSITWVTVSMPFKQLKPNKGEQTNGITLTVISIPEMQTNNA